MSVKVTRQIIRIDESKCNGCGQCVEACHEGAIRMVHGKAKLVSDIYCDGLGDCIGECPQGAITFETREAELYDEKAVQAHMEAVTGIDCQSGGCTGSKTRVLNKGNEPGNSSPVVSENGPMVSELGNWPVQLKLVPVNAPYLQSSDIVLAADCTAFSHGNFNQTFLKGENIVCLIGCPKLDDKEYYRDKIAEIMELNEIHSITVVYMEVPCCGGMVRLVEAAIEKARLDMDLKLVKIGIKGDNLGEKIIRYRYKQ